MSLSSIGVFLAALIVLIIFWLLASFLRQATGVIFSKLSVLFLSLADVAFAIASAALSAAKGLLREVIARTAGLPRDPEGGTSPVEHGGEVVLSAIRAWDWPLFGQAAVRGALAWGLLAVGYRYLVLADVTQQLALIDFLKLGGPIGDSIAFSLTAIDVLAGVAWDVLGLPSLFRLWPANVRRASEDPPERRERSLRRMVGAGMCGIFVGTLVLKVGMGIYRGVLLAPPSSGSSVFLDPRVLLLLLSAWLPALLSVATALAAQALVTAFFGALSLALVIPFSVIGLSTVALWFAVIALRQLESLGGAVLELGEVILKSARSLGDRTRSRVASEQEEVALAVVPSPIRKGQDRSSTPRWPQSWPNPLRASIAGFVTSVAATAALALNPLWIRAWSVVLLLGASQAQSRARERPVTVSNSSWRGHRGPAARTVWTRIGRWVGQHAPGAVLWCGRLVVLHALAMLLVAISLLFWLIVKQK